SRRVLLVITASSGFEDAGSLGVSSFSLGKAFMRTKLILAGLLLFLLVAGFFWYSAGSGIKLTDKDTLLIGDFANSTGDSAFDGSLREAVSIGLAQTPLLNLISAEKIAETLCSQSVEASTPITSDLGPRLCVQLDDSALLTG